MKVSIQLPPETAMKKRPQASKGQLGAAINSNLADLRFKMKLK